MQHIEVHLRKQRERRAPLLAGTNMDEGTVFVFPLYPQGLNASAFETLMRSVISGGAEAGHPVEERRRAGGGPAPAGGECRGTRGS